MLKVGDIVFVRRADKSAIHEFYGKIIRISNIIIVEEYRYWHRLCYPSEVKELIILCAGIF